MEDLSLDLRGRTFHLAMAAITTKHGSECWRQQVEITQVLNQKEVEEIVVEHKQLLKFCHKIVFQVGKTSATELNGCAPCALQRQPLAEVAGWPGAALEAVVEMLRLGCEPALRTAAHLWSKAPDENTKDQSGKG